MIGRKFLVFCLPLTWLLVIVLAGPISSPGLVKRSPSRALMYTGYFAGNQGEASNRKYHARSQEDLPTSYGTGMDADHDEVTGEESQQQQPQGEEISGTSKKDRPHSPIKPPKRPNDEEDDYDSRGLAPSFNAYFPLMFGWPGSSRRGSHGSSSGGYGGTGGGGSDWGNGGMMATSGGGGGGGQMPGVATAIANSFSTGRGAVASSHAVAYGSPQAQAAAAYKRLAGMRTKMNIPDW